MIPRNQSTSLRQGDAPRAENQKLFGSKIQASGLQYFQRGKFRISSLKKATERALHSGGKTGAAKWSSTSVQRQRSLREHNDWMHGRAQDRWVALGLGRWRADVSAGRLEASRLLLAVGIRGRAAGGAALREEAAAWTGGGGWTLLLLPLRRVEGRRRRRFSESARLAPRRRRVGRRPDRSARPAGGIAAPGRRRGFVYTYSQCAA